MTAVRRIKAVIRFEYFYLLVYCLYSGETTLELCRVYSSLSIFTCILKTNCIYFKVVKGNVD